MREQHLSNRLFSTTYITGVQRNNNMKECFSVPWAVEGLKEMFHTEGYCSFLAKEEEEVIGYVGMKMVLDESDITNVAVLPSHRKKGI